MLDRAWIEGWSGRYNDEHRLEKEIEARIEKALKQSPSYLTKDALANIEIWKWGRRRGLVDANEEEFIREVTRASFSAKSERFKLEVLTLLNGVGIRMASTILAFRYPQRYTVMDWRAWKSLKSFSMLEGEIEDTYDCWQRYNSVCQELAARNRVSLRKLDKALWQFNFVAIQRWQEIGPSDSAELKYQPDR